MWKKFLSPPPRRGGAGGITSRVIVTETVAVFVAQGGNGQHSLCRIVAVQASQEDAFIGRIRLCGGADDPSFPGTNISTSQGGIKLGVGVGGGRCGTTGQQHQQRQNAIGQGWDRSIAGTPVQFHIYSVSQDPGSWHNLPTGPPDAFLRAGSPGILHTHGPHAYYRW